MMIPLHQKGKITLVLCSVGNGIMQQGVKTCCKSYTVLDLGEEGGEQWLRADTQNRTQVRIR